MSDADAFHRGKGDVCMSERRYLNDPKEILERPIVDPTNSLQFSFTFLFFLLLNYESEVH